MKEAKIIEKEPSMLWPIDTEGNGNRYHPLFFGIHLLRRSRSNDDCCYLLVDEDETNEDSTLLC